MMRELLPNPLFEYTVLFQALLPVGALCVTAGFVGAIRRAESAQEKLMAIVQMIALIALMANFDYTVKSIKSTVLYIVEVKLQAKPEEVPTKFVKKVLKATPQQEERGLWDSITKVGTDILNAFLVAFLVVVSVGALAFHFLAYLSQELALEMGVGFSPLMLGLLGIQATRGVGVQFLLYMLAIAVFPLGWGAAALVSDRLIDLATSQDLAASAGAVASMSLPIRTVFGGLLLSIWIIVSTAVVPLALIKLVTTGSAAGTDMLPVVHSMRRFTGP